MGGSCPPLLDLIPKCEEEWTPTDLGYADERKLELRLAPPGHEDWVMVKQKRGEEEEEEEEEEEDSSGLTLSLFRNKSSKNTNNSSAGEKRSGFARMPSLKPPHKPVSANHLPSAPSVVGWPPIRSFRKNIAPSNSAKSSSENKKTEIRSSSSSSSSTLVKINMDGIPFGRKVDLKTHDSYSKLSSAVNELFRDLFAIQTEEEKVKKNKPVADDIIGSGILDGEFALVYEDIEGDRMLVGDVPWNMFVSTVKRLRVQKSSDLSPALALGGTDADRKHRSAPPVL